MLSSFLFINLFISNKYLEKIFSLAQQKLQNEANWLSANKLLLNADKTKYHTYCLTQTTKR